MKRKGQSPLKIDGSYSQEPNQRKNWGAECEITYIINGDSSIAEAASGLATVEISAVRGAIGAGEGAEEVVGAAIDWRIPNHEQRRNQRRRSGGRRFCRRGGMGVVAIDGEIGVELVDQFLGVLEGRSRARDQNCGEN